MLLEKILKSLKCIARKKLDEVVPSDTRFNVLQKESQAEKTNN